MKYFIFFLKFIVILIVTFYTTIFICSKTFGEFGINKTVGWAWDITKFIYFFDLFLFLTYTLIYSILFLLKVRTNTVFTVLSFVFIILVTVFKESAMISVFYMTSLLIFLSNVIYSIYLKFKSE